MIREKYAVYKKQNYGGIYGKQQRKDQVIGSLSQEILHSNRNFRRRKQEGITEEITQKSFHKLKGFNFEISRAHHTKCSECM